VKQSIFNSLLLLLEAQKNRSRQSAQASQLVVSRTRNFAEQISQYSSEYQKKWEETATLGAPATEMMSQRSFLDQLQATTQLQNVKLQEVERENKGLVRKAFSDHQRYKTLLAYSQKLAVNRRQEAERKEIRGIEDDFAGRKHR
jgi:flagellar biosynthesis chaperone FliJ